MPEERGLYLKMRVREQLIFLAELHGCSTAEAERGTDGWLAQLNVTDRAHDEVQALSHGNQQRVQLAAALVFAPDFLLLDEPFADLDPVAVDVLSDVLRQQADVGIPVVFSSHQLDLVERLCDRVGIIAHGEMVAIGTVDELRRTNIVGGLLWFVLGFTLYAVLFAAAGSLVSRVQDVQLASLPVIMRLIVAYLATLLVVLPDPNSLASTVLSLVPFLAPVAMPARMAAGAPAWQVVLAATLTLATIGAATWLAARIYANSVLRTGARIRLGEALQGR